MSSTASGSGSGTRKRGRLEEEFETQEEAVLLEENARKRIKLNTNEGNSDGEVSTNERDETKEDVIEPQTDDILINTSSSLVKLYPLHHACAIGCVETVSELLSKEDANVDMLGPYNSTPLHIASFFGRTDVVKLLIQKGARTDALDVYNRSPLVSAVFKENLELMEVLLTLGKADINFSSLMSPAHTAARFNKHHALNLLIQHGADMNRVDAKNCNVLHVACKSNSTQVVKLLMSQPNIDHAARDRGGRTAFLCAAKRRDPDPVILQELLEKGASINDKNANGNSAIHYAMLHSDDTLLDALLTLGIDRNLNFNARTANGNTALHLAATVGYTRGAAALLDMGAITNVRNNDTVFPFYLAARYGHLSVVELFLDKNPDDALCRSALYCAAKGGHPHVVSRLIQHGVSVNFTKKNNFTPLHRAAEKGSDDLVRMLIKNDADIEAITLPQENRAIHLSVMHGHANVLKTLLEKGANPDVKNSDKTTPMLIASGRGYPHIVEILYKSGVDLNKSINKQCALTVATSACREDVVIKLLQLGAETDAKGLHHTSSLHIACRDGYTNIAKALLDYGADAECMDRKGRTPFHYASFQSHLSVMQLLRARLRDVGGAKCRLVGSAPPAMSCCNCRSHYCVDCSIGKVNCEMCSFVSCRFCVDASMHRLEWNGIQNVCKQRCYKICLGKMHTLNGLGKCIGGEKYHDCVLFLT
ncbi:ankyrin [Acrasis kona]|uniref:Ankyrin n=1 Tax=Acrasis kona TaxID=1008807 RepID=A0AAW2ZB76_9EUKA